MPCKGLRQYGEFFSQVIRQYLLIISNVIVQSRWSYAFGSFVSAHKELAYSVNMLVEGVLLAVINASKASVALLKYALHTLLLRVLSVTKDRVPLDSGRELSRYRSHSIF
jgi:hypothetical protein